MAKVIKKAQSGIMSTKLKDVPGKVKKAATNVKDAVSAGFNKTVNKVKNTTVGDALKFVANPSYSAAESAVKSLNRSKLAKKAQKGVKATADSTKFYTKKNIDDTRKADFAYNRFSPGSKEFNDASHTQLNSLKSLSRQSKKGKPGYDANGFPVKKAMKAGGMLKRADGSYSKRGLWDNIRANKGSGKKPTSAMLKQEKKIKAKTK